MSRNGKGARNARAMAMVCTTLGLAAMTVAPRARSEPAVPPADAPAWIEAEHPSGTAFVYPPSAQADAPRPVTILLHGMGGEPRSACGPFVGVSTARGWLVCPRGEDPLGSGTRWRLRSDDAKLVDASVRALAGDHPGKVDDSVPRVIVGFSLGGIAAVRIAQASPPGKYAGLVVIASQVRPDAAALKAAGVRRVVLAAGDLDITSAPLRESARELDAAGLPTRFVSLGRVGHGYPADMEERMREPMEWVAGRGAEDATRPVIGASGP